MSEDMLQKVFTKLVEIETNNKKQFGELHEMVDTKFSTLTKKVDGIAEQVRINAENISGIDNKLEKLDSTIDLLSRRSIDQEAELKRIK